MKNFFVFIKFFPKEYERLTSDIAASYSTIDKFFALNGNLSLTI